MLYTEIAEALGTCGLSVTPDFLSADEVREVREDLRSLKAHGKFKAAGVGRGSELEVHESIRQNDLCWLDRENANDCQRLIWQKLDALKLAFNRTLFLGVQSFEGHYAIYPPGGFYKRHLDSFASDPARVVSMILYLNENWEEVHGGKLRIYQNETHLDVRPLAGTLACFLSRDSEHEVLLNHHERLSFTGWFKQTP
jgi:SM-20-related protein